MSIRVVTSTSLLSVFAQDGEGSKAKVGTTARGRTRAFGKTLFWAPLGTDSISLPMTGSVKEYDPAVGKEGPSKHTATREEIMRAFVCGIILPGQTSP